MAKRDVMRAIRAKCFECSCGSYPEVAKCPVTDCSLYIFRFGKDPLASKKMKEDVQDEEVEGDE